MSLNCGLGNLSRFPFEIRLQIWQHLSTSVLHQRLPILLTSRQIREEFPEPPYSETVLHFQVLPEYIHPCWLMVESSAGAKWRLRHFYDAKLQGFSTLPYHKLNGIVIEVQAPSWEDPGQIVCLWQKCWDLVELLERSRYGFPDLEIHLKDMTLTKWVVRGDPQRTVHSGRLKYYPVRNEVNDRDDAADILYDDWEIALMPFERLRNARHAKVHVPDDLVSDRVSDYVSNLETVLQDKRPFGTNRDPGDPPNDRIIRRSLDKMYLDLDFELDVLPGPTANMMRLERFSSWYATGLCSESRYERELTRILPNHKKRFSLMNTFYTIDSSNTIWHIRYRYIAMRAFNPKSVYNRFLAGTGEEDMEKAPFLFEGAATVFEAFDRHLIEEEWDRNAWHNGCYPNGIAPFDTWEFCELEIAGSHNPVTDIYKAEFDRKLCKMLGSDACCVRDEYPYDRPIELKRRWAERNDSDDE